MDKLLPNILKKENYFLFYSKRNLPNTDYEADQLANNKGQLLNYNKLQSEINCR